jgi:hypothetical protein
MAEEANLIKGAYSSVYREHPIKGDIQNHA